MKVILLQDIAKIGRKYDVKTVSPGYALNFLLPKKLAKRAGNNAEQEAAELKQKTGAMAEAERKDGLVGAIQEAGEVTVQFEESANEQGVLFAGIDARAVAEKLSETLNTVVAPEDITLDKPIKTTGAHSVSIAGDTEIKVSIAAKA